MEMTFKDQVKMHDRFMDNKKLEYISEGIFLTPLQHWQAWGIVYLPRKPLPVFDRTHSTEIFHHILFEPSLVQLCTIPLHLVLGDQGEYLCLHFPSSGSCGEQWDHFSASFSSDWTVSVSMASPHCTCLPPPLTVLPSSGCFQVLFTLWSSELCTVFKLRPY